MNWSLRKEGLNKWPGFSNKTLVYPGEVKSWDSQIQSVVVSAIEKQYSDLGLNASKSIESLKASTATTVTTGHQLQLFGGPAFLHYKTLATIRKARLLQDEPGTPVVPIFWMASEDHDFAEISWVWGRGEKFTWNYPSEVEKLPVGVLPLTGLREVAEAWLAEASLTESDSATILNCLSESESRGESYAKFFHRLMHAWYGDTGLIVLDAAAPELKALASKLFADELSGSGIAEAVRTTTARLESSGEKTQAHIREVSLFHMPPNSPRIGIVESEKFLTAKPHHLSPSVLLRPLYQELLLPNRIVVLGPGEAAYWQQLDDAFTQCGIPKPELHLRDHALWLSKANQGLTEVWPKVDELQAEYIDSKFRDQFADELKSIESALSSASAAMFSMVSDLDKSLDGTRGAADAALQKALKSFIKKAKRSLRRTEFSALAQIESAALEIVRDGSPQDRWANLHVLSASIGGFVNSREKLLEIHKDLEPVKIVFDESD